MDFILYRLRICDRSGYEDVYKRQPLHKALGVYLPLITTNCAVLGVCINNIDAGYGYLMSICNAFGAGVGFLLAMVLFAGVRSLSLIHI